MLLGGQLGRSLCRFCYFNNNVSKSIKNLRSYRSAGINSYRTIISRTLCSTVTNSDQNQNQDVKAEAESQSVDDHKDKFLEESASETYLPFEDKGKVIQDVIDEMWNPQQPQPQPIYVPPPHFITRGVSGVFDLPELIDLLRKEKADEIITVNIPPEMDYADYVVIVTCLSPRQLVATARYVRKRFKMKRLRRRDVIPVTVESGGGGWVALDLGNIILHLFLQQQRDLYDLELLWAVGAAHDDLVNAKDSQLIQLLNSIH